MKRLALFVAMLVSSACMQPDSESQDMAAAPSSESYAACDAPEVRSVVASFGERLKQVSLLAADTTVARELRTAYGSLITPSLLEQWSVAPAHAPGREGSSPWPERIAIRKVSETGPGACRVEGEIEYGSSSGRVDVDVAIVLELVHADGGWRIDAVERDAVDPGQADPAGTEHTGTAAEGAASAAAVLRAYYAAVAAGDYASAYALWSRDGAASGQTLGEFAAGYADTDQVDVTIGSPGRIEGAAGSRFIVIPVSVRARTSEGERQHFEGTYTLRRSVVDGASAEQRAWRIHAAEITRTTVP